ncbi:MFS general substrate transporter [Coniochaeta ligniaria NRRL 30616]|uniref:MFS general substrate transporter n=1 Tax=Coniochaeta ligniaria NRRL 30616 TaxID=1408157 RepID=A0A1J7JDT0_9PEZI|nr:MFS general substrate transporter [Coniochaeta ligniaria NRRL 30616]
MSRSNSPSPRDIEEGDKRNVASDSGEETAVSFTAPAEKEGAASEPPVWVNDAPDGGTRAWLCVLGAWCTSFCSFGWLNSIGAFQEYYETGPLRDYSASTISWIPSLQIFFMMAMGPIVGKIYDSYGPRPLLIGGTFLHVFGLMMASISKTYYQFLLSQGVCSAIGVSMVFQPGINTIVTWFHLKRGAAYGILSTGSSIGGIIFPIMITRLIRQVGYGWAMRSGAFMILGLLIIANFTVTSRHPPKPRPLSKEQMSKPLRERGFLILLAGMFTLSLGVFVPINYLQIQGLQAGMRPELAQYLIAILNAASLFGRLLSGLLADKVGKYNVFITATGTAGIFTLGLWIPAKGDPSIIAYAVLYGFFSGAYVSLMGALVAQISPLPEIGYRTGLVFLTCSISGLIANPIAGQILDNTSGHWNGLKAFAGAVLLGGTAIMIVCRLSFTGMHLKKIF